MTASRSQPAIGAALWILVTIAILFLLRAASSLLIPIVFAILISYVLAPAVTWLARWHIPRAAGAAFVMVALLALGAVGAYAMRDEATQAAQAVPQLVERARQMITPGDDTANPPPDGSSGSVPVPAGLLGAIQTVAGSVFTFAGNVTVVFFLCFFLLAGHHSKGPILEIVGPDVERRRQFTTIINDVNAQIQRFLVVRLITAMVVGALTWLALVWMGVANAGVWGLLAGTFNSIPYFGPIVVSGGLFLVGLVQDGGMVQALQMAGVALLITSLEGWLLTPLLLGKAENMNALTVFVGLLVWTWIWGAWGTILAVPMLVIAKAVADHTPSLKPFGRLMGP